MVKDVLMKDQAATSLIGGDNLSAIVVKVFRFTQSLDDPTLLFWRPNNIKDEWPFIFLLKLAEGILLPNNDLGESV